MKPKLLPSPVPATVTKVVGRRTHEYTVTVKLKSGRTKTRSKVLDGGSYCQTTEKKTGIVHTHMNWMVNAVPLALRKVGVKGYIYWEGHTQFAFFRKDK